jgi:hypothetical protein
MVLRQRDAGTYLHPRPAVARLEPNPIRTRSDAPMGLRAAVIGGMRHPDDYTVIWRGLTIGRIMLAPGLPPHVPQWSRCQQRLPHLTAHEVSEIDRGNWKLDVQMSFADVFIEMNDMQVLCSKDLFSRTGINNFFQV